MDTGCSLDNLLEAMVIGMVGEKESMPSAWLDNNDDDKLEQFMIININY